MSSEKRTFFRYGAVAILFLLFLLLATFPIFLMSNFRQWLTEASEQAWQQDLFWFGLFAWVITVACIGAVVLARIGSGQKLIRRHKRLY